MQEMLTESELSLVHALQIAPRASWTDLAPILGSTAATLARRWHSIVERGLAWITAYPAPLTGAGAITAMIEVTCGRVGSAELVDALVQDPRVVSIEHAARGRDLVLTVQTSSLDELTGLVLDDLPGFDSVRSTQTHTCTALHVEGSRWRLDSLDGAQHSAVAALGESPDRSGYARPESLTDQVARSLVGELTGNGRASAPEIASALGRPTSSVRRQLAALLRSRAVVLRCEVAQDATRWPITVTWWCRLPVQAHQEVVEIIRARSELRLCMSLTGPANFLLSMWVSSVPEILRVQEWLESRAPSLHIIESSVTLRSRKRMGWELGAEGRATGYVTTSGGSTWTLPR
ncbi:Lrp/AsnC family transcriptional regulator [Rhodococcus sp. NPDC079359]|uniref:Lrp/AsnC family transcriptional regulator n=1 Tax=unclassified Rhodococcus (in: high G+C Gram-positive bacteria) TaxID=192944 RepID=UPI00295429BD|nr:Lrp/AsnC family transcriptional regulator [Rhodococcus sp. IEGM 1414]MDV8033665.1 Lrp/AsnC family transcriptional regulator [Rhodococcus sp. IEGM 1414]